MSWTMSRAHLKAEVINSERDQNFSVTFICKDADFGLHCGFSWEI